MPLIRNLFLFFILCLGSGAFAITGEEIIRRVDANMTFGFARIEVKMKIRIGDEIRTKELVQYAKGREASFAEFISPARDKGVKYLKIEDNMWMYLPSVEKIIKIEGHMLRQSMMGSDFSYEDALESPSLLEKYTATLISEDPVYLVELTAKVKNVAYYRRRIWVDRELFVPIREELFALSGKKLKEMTAGNIQKFGARHYPMYYSMSNLLRKNSLTEMFVTRAQFDIRIPDEIFTQRNLRK